MSWGYAHVRPFDPHFRNNEDDDGDNTIDVFLCMHVQADVWHGF